MQNTQQTDEQNLSAPKEPEVVESGTALSKDDPSQLYGALKCYFYTPKRGEIWGAFCFLFNGTTGESMDNVFWVTRSLAGPAIDVNMGWRELNKLIPGMGTYEKSLGEKLIVSMLESFTPTARIELLKEADPTERLLKLSGEIRNGFERTTHYFLEFKTALERLTRQDLISAGLLAKEGEEASTPEAEKSEEEQKSFAGTLITCLPVIDPVHGTPVSELRPGDMLEVKIQGGVGAGELIQKYLTSTNQDAVFPVESIEKKDGDKTFVFLTINDEIKGLITVTKDLRLRTLKIGSRKKTTITINTDNLIFFGTLGVAVLVILLVIRFVFF